MSSLIYCGKHFTSRQAERLLRELSARDWRVSITLAEGVALPISRPLKTCPWGCQVNRGDLGGSRCGKSLWDCLSRAVVDLIIPVTANNRQQP